MVRTDGLMVYRIFVRMFDVFWWYASRFLLVVVFYRFFQHFYVLFFFSELEARTFCGGRSRLTFSMQYSVSL